MIQKYDIRIESNNLNDSIRFDEPNQAMGCLGITSLKFVLDLNDGSREEGPSMLKKGGG